MKIIIYFLFKSFTKRAPCKKKVSDIAVPAYHSHDKYARKLHYILIHSRLRLSFNYYLKLLLFCDVIISRLSLHHHHTHVRLLLKKKRFACEENCIWISFSIHVL